MYSLNFEYTLTISNHVFPTGIAGRSLRPLLGIVDPHHVRYMPQNVAIFSGFDVLW